MLITFYWEELAVLHTQVRFVRPSLQSKKKKIFVWQPRPSVTSINVIAVRPISMKFRMGFFLYKMLSSENGYGEHGISDRHNLLRNVNEFIPV